MILHVAQLPGQETVAGGTKGSKRRQKMAKTEGHLRCNGVRVTFCKSFKRPSFTHQTGTAKGLTNWHHMSIFWIATDCLQARCKWNPFRGEPSYFNACWGYRIKEREGFPHCSWHVYAAGNKLKVWDCTRGSLSFPIQLIQQNTLSTTCGRPASRQRPLELSQDRPGAFRPRKGRITLKTGQNWKTKAQFLQAVPLRSPVFLKDVHLTALSRMGIICLYGLKHKSPQRSFTASLRVFCLLFLAMILIT